MAILIHFYDDYSSCQANYEIWSISNILRAQLWDIKRIVVKRYAFSSKSCKYLQLLMLGNRSLIG